MRGAKVAARWGRWDGWWSRSVRDGGAESWVDQCRDGLRVGAEVEGCTGESVMS